MLSAKLLIAAAAAAAVSAVPFHLSNVFGSSMVLQRNKPVPIWGWANAGTTVQTTFQGTTYNATADSTGLWKLTLPSQPANAVPSTLAFTASTGESQTLSDVLFGDVILCSGQSNMEVTVNWAANATAEIAAANNYPLIRITSGPEQGSFNLNTVTPGPYNELAVTNLPWSHATNITVGCLVAGCSGWNYLSAACWFTVRDTFDALGGSVPMGAIAQTYGGTSIQWWSPAEALAQCDAPPGSACCNYGGNSSCLYDSQIAPYTIGPTGLTAALWYQGEQNANCGGPPQIGYYGCALPALVSWWRVKFGAPDLPFGVFLLAAWESSDLVSFPLLRLQQVNASINVVNVFTASTLDRGDPATGAVHSPYKQDPAKRASQALLNLAYYQTQTAYLGPRYTGAAAVASAPGSLTVQVSFDPTTLYGAGLTLNTSVVCPPGIAVTSCEAFAIQTSDCAWRANGTAALSSDAMSLLITVPAPAGVTAVATRGYFANWPLVQVYNAAGLPAEPWLANITDVTNACPSPWSQAAEIDAAAAVHWVDTTGQHA